MSVTSAPALYRYDCIIMYCYIEMMMSVLQEVKGKLYFVIYTSSRKTSYHANFQVQCLHGLPVLT